MARTAANKWLNGALIFAAILFATYGTIVFKYGAIDFPETFRTKYHAIENTNFQFIETRFFKIKTPEDWYHIFSGYGEEGEPFGTFQTDKGIIYYEYNILGGYENYSPRKTFEERKINRFNVAIDKHADESWNVAIPLQNEMKANLHLTSMEEENLADILTSIETISFK